MEDHKQNTKQEYDNVKNELAQLKAEGVSKTEIERARRDYQERVTRMKQEYEEELNRAREVVLGLETKNRNQASLLSEHNS
jgi:hypothetical protein